MSYRAGVILLQGDQVLLIERARAGLHYFTFPGGHVEEGETPEQAAIRETEEELGLQVKLIQPVAQFGWQGKWQYYFLVELTGGTFGSGNGEEMLEPLPERGTYRPMWMPVSELLNRPVKPCELAQLVARAVKDGWPEQPVVIPEAHP